MHDIRSAFLICIDISCKAWYTLTMLDKEVCYIMVTKEETGRYLKRMAESRPKKIFEQFDNTNAGIGCVLRYLSECGGPVSAGEISAYMKVSTARVAVLLKKMLEKDLITKEYDPNDARKTMITLSDNGKNMIKNTKDDFNSFFSTVIDRMGQDRFEQFMTLSEELRDIINEEAEKRSKSFVADCDKNS